MHVELVVADRQDAPIAFFLLEKRRLQIDELCLEDRFDLALELVELALVVGVYGDVDADVEYLFLGLLKGVAQALEVLIGRVEGRVADEAALFAAR